MTNNNIFYSIGGFMKNIKLLGLLLMFYFVASTIYPQEGFTGPGSREKIRQYKTITVSEAKNLPDDSLVVLTGNIIQSLGDEKYKFRDSTGEIIIEIDQKIWRGLSVSVSDIVEISGEVDIERGRIEIEVKSIRK